MLKSAYNELRANFTAVAACQKNPSNSLTYNPFQNRMGNFNAFQANPLQITHLAFNTNTSFQTTATTPMTSQNFEQINVLAFKP